ncbi:hypothetical protein FQA39_LY14857 [Lamprigera yunnana]|nr:hypothetical protein FQA39_LY14857 [Lamprigera yunnana]
MYEICRTCLEEIRDNSVTVCLNSSDSKLETITVGKKLTYCFPEIDLDVAPNAVICRTCFKSLTVAHEFKTKCLETEGRIQSYIEQMGYILTCINLRDIAQQKQETADLKNLSLSIYDTKKSTIQTQTNESSLDIKNLHCDTKNFFTVPKIAQLLATEHLYKCDNCNYTTSDIVEFRNHKENHIHKCNKCDYHAPKRQILILHMRKHADEERVLKKLNSYDKPYKCLLCEYASSHKSNLRHHMQIHIGKKCKTKMYKCGLCDYTTTHSKSLNLHVSTHLKDKLYSCTFCNYNTSNKFNFLKHVTIHNGDKFLHCFRCGYKTTTKSDLQIHMHVHMCAFSESSVQSENDVANSAVNKIT